MEFIAKNRKHSYSFIYEKLLKTKENEKLTILEIVEKEEKFDLWTTNEVYYINSAEAYNKEAIDKFNNKKFDFIIDRGSKRFKDEVFVITNYLKLLKNNGILIIEDIQSIRYVRYLYENVPNDLKKYIESYDLREVKGRYDDIIFIINKSSFAPEEEVPEEVPKEVPNEIPNEIPNLKLDIYKLLTKRRRMEINTILDIGLKDEEMIKYWLNYFPKSYIFGIGEGKDVNKELMENNRVKFYLDTNPTDINLNTSSVRFDLIIYNDVNSLDKIIFILNIYSRLLKEDGLMIIDNVKTEDLEKINEKIPEELNNFVEIYKLKMNNLLIVNKEQLNNLNE
jgi:predicted O-methyltransferase YrrM